MKSRRSTGALPFVWAVLLVVPCILGLRALPAMDNAAAAPILLLAVLVSARTWGTGPALVTSASATAAYTYFFVGSIGFALKDPSDWAAFITFSISALIVGELSGRAERRHLEAQAGRREIERLYQELQAACDRASEAEAARRNEALKAALLDALTHNLRTPLTAIKASVTALIEASDWLEQDGLSRENRKELLQVIDEESDRLNRFIEGLSSARPEQAQPISHRAVRVEDLIRAALTRAETVTRDHQVQLSIEDSMPPLSVDAPAVVEVLYILLDNASKYSPAGTRIRVRAWVGWVEDDRFARIAVVDEGLGIPPAMRDQVFDKFFRIPGRDPVDSRRAPGIGLGLPIARRLVEAQAGRIWVESPSSGSGTAMMLSLPLAEQPREASVELARSAAS